MREFLSLMINPIPVLCLLIITAISFFLLHKKKAGRYFLGLAAGWFLIITTPPVPKMLVRYLEDQYPQISDSTISELPDTCNILILGGGHSDDKTLSPNNQLSATALGRLTEGIRIHRRVPGSTLIMSGYGGRTSLPQAVVLYRTALILGEDSTSIRIMTLPSNTQMEAAEYSRNFGSQKNPVLVTSDLHMPRAMMLFRKEGLNPVPAPTNSLIKVGSVKNPWRWIPSTDNTGMMKAAIHEYIGIFWANVGGR
jgi:uncharacterized SAM-binding protein YcdF (DUF218 family)